jgi:hypothetical protein
MEEGALCDACTTSLARRMVNLCASYSTFLVLAENLLYNEWNDSNFFSHHFAQKKYVHPKSIAKCMRNIKLCKECWNYGDFNLVSAYFRVKKLHVIFDDMLLVCREYI